MADMLVNGRRLLIVGGNYRFPPADIPQVLKNKGDPQLIEKTATEINSAKQRSYAAVCELQNALEAALRDLIRCMDFYASLYKLAPAGDFEISFTWGDGILEDTDKEFQRRKQLVDAGYLKPEKLLAWYFGISEEEAAGMVPAKQEELGFSV